MSFVQPLVPAIDRLGTGREELLTVCGEAWGKEGWRDVDEVFV